ncbi:hypothetical protein JCM5353_007826, partial [Sporobolomyces roseus]
MQEPPGLSRRDSSPLSSLTPSPEPEPRPSKRPRLSISPQPQQPLFFAKHRSQSAVQQEKQEEEIKQNEDLSALLEGLDEQEFDLPPSSDPVMRREDGDTDDEGHDLEVTVMSGRLREARREADDSGIGLIEEEEIQYSKEQPAEPPDKIERQDRDDEYEGDDMWLGFDDQEMGFDQPDAFPSSILSPAPPSTEDRQPEPSIEVAQVRDGKEEIEEGEEKEEEERKPADLGSFGFSNLNPSGGFVFATRKSFAPSAAALKRAQALFEDDEPSTSSTNLESTTTLQNPFQSASTVPLPPRPTTTLPSLRPDSATTSLPSRDLFPDSRLSLHPSLPSFNRAAVPSLSTPAVSSAQDNSTLVSFASSRQTLDVPQKEPALVAPKPQHPPPTNPLLFGFQNAAGRSIVLPSGDALERARRRMDKSSSPDRSQASTPRPPSAALSRAPSRNGGGDADLFGTGSENREPKAFTLAPVALLDQVPTKATNRLDPFDSPSALRTRSFIQTEETDTMNANGRRSPLVPVENVVSLIPDEDTTSEHGSTTTTVTSSSPRKIDQSPPPAARNQDRPPLASPSLFKPF